MIITIWQSFALKPLTSFRKPLMALEFKHHFKHQLLLSSTLKRMSGSSSNTNKLTAGSGVPPVTEMLSYRQQLWLPAPCRCLPSPAPQPPPPGTAPWWAGWMPLATSRPGSGVSIPLTPKPTSKHPSKASCSPQIPREGISSPLFGHAIRIPDQDCEGWVLRNR